MQSKKKKRGRKIKMWILIERKIDRKGSSEESDCKIEPAKCEV